MANVRSAVENINKILCDLTELKLVTESVVREWYKVSEDIPKFIPIFQNSDNSFIAIAPTKYLYSFHMRRSYLICQFFVFK